jgi:B-box zinc finger
MNCATHSDTAAVAFCRTCGKPLCNQCTRDVRGVIYCEACLAARMEGAASAPAAGFVPPQGPPQTGYQQFMDQGLGLKVQPGPASGPNPTVAGILGAIPLGLGAVYCGQYAKGLVHLGIFVAAIVGLSSDLPWQAYMVLGIFLGFFWVYQILDAVRTARAIQANEPVPDPFGLASTFGVGEKSDNTKVPAAASFLADHSHRARGVALCQALGTAGKLSPLLRLRTMPHPQIDGAGNSGDDRRALSARQRWTAGISQNLARHPAGDRSDQAGAEQRFDERTHRPVASRRAAECSTRIPAECSAAAGAPEPGAVRFFWRGEKCLAQSRRIQCRPQHFRRFLRCRRGGSGPSPDRSF